MLYYAVLEKWRRECDTMLFSSSGKEVCDCMLVLEKWRRECDTVLFSSSGICFVTHSATSKSSTTPTRRRTPPRLCSRRKSRSR